MSLKGRAVVIMTPSWAHGDGVGHDVEGMARALLSAGCKVLVYAPDYYAPAYADWRVHVDTVRQLLEEPSTILIYHHSIGCEATENLLKYSKCEIRILRYHNVTPAEFFEGYNEDWVRGCTAGRNATISIAKLCNEFSVPSFYDARDLVHAGAPIDRISYTPYFHKLADFDLVDPGEAVANQLKNDPRFQVLFLGRRVNNKGHLHLVRTIAAYVQRFDRNIVLHLVGAADPGLKRYDSEIHDEIRSYGIEANVIFHDKVPFPDIVAFYKGCDAFLCMSEHEGFCIPVIEAEYCGLPVLAHYRRGVPEALGPTQPWLTSLNYEAYALILRRMRDDPAYARELGLAGAASVRERFDIADIQKRFLEWMEDLVVQLSPAAAAKKPSGLPRRRKLAFVVQRFGSTVAGGAEAFARMYADRLSLTYDITVLTTTSKTWDWDNDLMFAAPEKELSSVEVLRFPPRRRRTLEDFRQATDKLLAGDIDYAEWQVHHGPDAPEIADFLHAHADSYDLVVNWTYLFATSTYASQLAGRVKLVNVPFFHDELWLHLEGAKHNALRYDANIYQTEAEKSLAERVVDGISEHRSLVLGAGVDEATLDQVKATEADPPIDAPYIVYVGRIETVKGVPELVALFRRFKRDFSTCIKLVIIGRSHDCEIEEEDDIILTGFLSEEEKAQYIKHARCLVNPSPLESFSLVLIEAWALGRPVMVTGHCAATKSQVERSGGGFVYKNYREFAWALRQAIEDQDLIKRLGDNGQEYYQQNYRWNVLIPKITSFFDSMIEKHPGQ